MKKKGMIFVTDALMAIIIVFLIILAAQAQMRGVELDQWDQVYAKKLGGDMLAVLDEQGVLQSLDEVSIESNLSEILPYNYEMWMEIECYSYSGDFLLNETIEVGGLPSDDSTRVGGQRVFISGNGTVERYNIARYKIWLR